MNRMRGSISVFMIFILASLLAASGTLLEGSRYYAVRTFSKTTLKQAGNSIMTEYYKPLFEEYHLLFLAMGSEEVSEQETLLAEKITDYMEYSLNPQKELDTKGSYVNLIMPNIKELSVEDIVHGTDSDTEVFEQEVSAYMKYKSLDSILEKILSKFEFAKSLGKAAGVLEEKVKAEQNMSELSTEILEVMELVEGVSVNESGGVSSKQNFAKQYVYGTVNQQNVGINQQQVWTSLKGKYINVDGMLRAIENSINDIRSAKAEISEFNTEVADVKDESSNKEDKNKDEEKIKKLEDKVADDVSSIKSNIKSITKSLKSVENKIEKAINKIGFLESMQQDAAEGVSAYRETLNNSSADLGDSAYETLSEDCQTLEDYVGTGDSSEVSHIINMSSVLSNNLNCLKGLEQLSNISISSSDSSLTSLESSITECRNNMQSYNISSLQFNYGSADFEKCKNPIDSVKQVMSDSIFDLVIKNTSEVSGNQLYTADALANEYIGKEEGVSSNISSLIKSLSIDNIDFSGMFSELSEGSTFDVSTLTNIAKPFLVNQYICECFSRYTDELEQEQAVHYEQEYILYGDKQDEENLKGNINNLMVWRTVLNFLSILGDHDKGNMAYTTAAALVGFTGIEPMVRLTKFLILIAWSFAESLVDVAALLAGKEIPIFKSGKDFSVEYADLFLISKETIQVKAERVADLDGAGMKYEDWMELFLLLKNGDRQNYRVMDLITENIKLRYNNNYSMKSTIFSFKVSASFQANYKFAVFPFQKDFFKGNSFWSVKENTYISFS